MKLRLGILLVALAAGQVLSAMQDQMPVVCEMKQQEEKGFLQKTKVFVKKYAVEIIASATALGGAWFMWRQFFGSEAAARKRFDVSDALAKNGIDDLLSSQGVLQVKNRIIDEEFSQFLDNLPKHHGQTMWLFDTDKVRFKKLLQRVFDGEKNDPAGDFLRLLRQPGILRKDEAGIRTTTLRIDQNKAIETKMKEFLEKMEKLARINKFNKETEKQK